MIANGKIVVVIVTVIVAVLVNVIVINITGTYLMHKLVFIFLIDNFITDGCLLVVSGSSGIRWMSAVSGGSGIR